MELSIEGADVIVAELNGLPSQIDRAMVRALNRSIVSGRTVMARAIAQDTGLRVKDVTDAIRTTQATASNLEATLAASLARIPLVKFGARGPEPSRGRGRGVSYRDGSGRSRVETGFLATMASGHRGVFMRRGTGRLPIRELYGPSLGHVFAKFRPQGIARVAEVFEANFDHEMGFAASQAPADAA